MSASDDMPAIHVVDDEAPFRRSLLFLLESVGWKAVGHESAEAFLEAAPAFPAGGGCIVLDIRMPRVSGLELQRRLLAAGSSFPVIFMTGHGDVELAVQAMKDGALDFLQKPFKDQIFLDAVERAVQLSRERHAVQRRQGEARDVLARLSARLHAGSGDFTVNIALICGGKPVAGCVYAPARREMYFGGAEAHLIEGFAPGEPLREGRLLKTRPYPAEGLTAMTSSSHLDDRTKAFLATHRIASQTAIGSSLKFCWLAAGKADAVAFGKAWVTECLKSAYPLGGGHGPVSALWRLQA